MHDFLRTRYPIIQAPMAGSDTPEFVAAACNAGIMGSLGGQYRTPAELQKAIADIRAITDKPFSVNLFALSEVAAPDGEQIAGARAHLQKYYDHFGLAAPSVESVKTMIDPEAQLEVILAARVPAFSFTLGIPKASWIDAFKRASILLIGTATNVKEARALESAGVDAITTQGAEAGGHRGTFIGNFENSLIGGLALIPQVVDAVKIPVIAAGGIMDGRGIVAALSLGAQAVQMGTAFLTVSESPVNAAYKKAIQKHDADDTTITKVFSGGAARGIENVYILENKEVSLLPFPYQNSLTRGFRKLANQSGQLEYTNLWSGQGGRLAKEMSMNDFVETLISETEELLKRLGQFRIR